MGIRSGFLACAVALAVCVPAGATSVVNDIWDTSIATDELNFFEVYNEIYASLGANFSSTNGATGGDLLSGGLDDMCTDLEIFMSGVGVDGLVEFQAHYAGYAARIGYYVGPDGTLPTGDPSMGASNGDFVHLFDVINQSTVNPSDTATIAAADLAGGIGLYNNVRLGGATTWYSEIALNSDGMDHLIVYRGLGEDADGNIFIRDDQWVIGWEDRRRLGDMDYNDVVMVVTIAQDDPPTDIVPEPATTALLVMGLAGVLIRRRFLA
jgi:hypothetical protein